MPDDLERQLEKFGQTLADRTGEGITRGASPSRVPRRWWAIGGAAACLIAVVVGLAAIAGSNSVEAPAGVPDTDGTVHTDGTVTDEQLRTAPIAELLGGCDPIDVVVSADYVETAGSLEAAYEVVHRGIAEHTVAAEPAFPLDGWTEVLGDPTSVFFLDRGQGVEALARIVHEGDHWKVAELAQCVSGREETTIETTTVPRVPLAEWVPDDPLGLERDGWTLLERSTERFETPVELDCPAVTDMGAIDGVEQVHDIVTPPDSAGLDVDIQTLAVGSLDVGNALADAVLAIGQCIEDEGVSVETSALSSVRASWFRAGPDFALMTVVGEGGTSIVLEIENDQFTDGLLAELAQRAAEFLRTGEPATKPPGPGLSPVIDVEEGAAVGTVQRDPAPGELLLWVSNQSFDEDPVVIEIAIDGVPVVTDQFSVEGQHNWRSWFVGGDMAAGEHAITATSDSGTTWSGTVAIDADAPAWAVIDYWYSEGDASGSFTFDQSDEPILFD